MNPAPNRRWCRFSLRTLFVVTTVVAGFLPIAIAAHKRYSKPAKLDGWAMLDSVEQIKFDCFPKHANGQVPAEFVALMNSAPR